ncbi:MAG: large subunit ribosomal protein L25 [Parcubacteria group bacterium Gr01-1014_3]|nr:MAG: large subunit ribosomal protein L25 [Parcubacteria group bacterium Gr01-1014_3]
MDLQVQTREKFGKAVKTLRQAGMIPAELYGKGIENLHLVVALKDLRKVLKQAGESSMINVVLGKDKRPAMISNVELDPVSDAINTVDFYQVRLDEKIKVKVPFEFVGESVAVTGEKGILVKPMQEVEVEALPAEMPQNIKVDLSKITKIGESVYVKDLNIPTGVKLLVNDDTVVATVTAPMTEEEEAKLAAEVKIEDIKVETEEKKAERDAVKAATDVAKAPEAASKTK